MCVYVLYRGFRINPGKYYLILSSRGLSFKTITYVFVVRKSDGKTILIMIKLIEMCVCFLFVFVQAKRYSNPIET